MIVSKTQLILAGVVFVLIISIAYTSGVFKGMQLK